MGVLRRGLLGFLAALALAPAAALGQCAADRVEIRGSWGSAAFDVELAITPEEQSRGLMFRESMPSMAGMLFVYDGAREVGFWMRNTLIPLDMIFVGPEGRVARVHENAVPLDETPIRSEAPVIAVLEVNGGTAERLGIAAGDEVRSVVLPQEGAAWPCAEAAE